ncbi:MFS transporter [Bacillus sp. FJAT-45350]|uniref:MFS transporter n=1 Tax=Bacillus sp. FJAT-45350 TaxID=2011014 RepID=UPI000BB9235C|nr:MFS transporter [Bacillus sp. FJAT-45350]
MKNSKVHRGWIILVVTVLNVLAGLGFGRFSFAAIIPFMREGLSISYSEAGIIASAIFLGYLVSATVVGHLVSRFSAKKVILTALAITILGMGLSSIVINFWTAYLTCFLIGIGSGGVNVASLGLVGKWFSAKYRGTALGVTNSGSSFGMVASGFLVPFLITMFPSEGWRVSWIVLAVLSIIILLINFFLLVDDPKKIGLKPVGETEGPKFSGKSSINVEEENKIVNVYKSNMIWVIGLIFFSWGFSYLIFSTFFVDYLINTVQLEKQTAGFFFSSAGFVSIVSGFLLGGLSDRIGRMPTLFIVCFIQAGILIGFALTTHQTILYIQSVIYALTLWGVPTVTVATVSEITRADKTTVAIGFITIFFGIGQWLSPIVTGYIIDATQSYTIAFYLSAFVCYLGCLGCVYVYLKQKQNKKSKVEQVEREGITS